MAIPAYKYGSSAESVGKFGRIWRILFLLPSSLTAICVTADLLRSGRGACLTGFQPYRANGNTGRLRAADCVLGHAAKAIDLQDIECASSTQHRARFIIDVTGECYEYCTRHSYHFGKQLFLACLFGDQITLTNGDTITGAIVKKDGDKLTMKGELLGEVTVPWTAVKAIKSDQPLFVALANGTEVSGAITTQGESIQIAATPNPQSTGLKDVRGPLSLSHPLFTIICVSWRSLE